MGWQVFFSGLLGAVLVAVINGISMGRKTRKQSMHEFVTGERSAYREEVRALAVALVSDGGTAAYGSKEDIRNRLILRLNPYDEFDNKLVELMNQILRDPGDEDAKAQFIYNVQCMLKYDWERAKEEAGAGRKRSEWKKYVHQVGAALATAKVTESIKMKLGANRELPQAPREFHMKSDKKEE